MYKQRRKQQDNDVYHPRKYEQIILYYYDKHLFINLNN